MEKVIIKFVTILRGVYQPTAKLAKLGGEERSGDENSAINWETRFIYGAQKNPKLHNEKDVE